jgi:hypothetical protein
MSAPSKKFRPQRRRIFNRPARHSERKELERKPNAAMTVAGL